MSAKPLKNSKGVNKPFRSPFSTPDCNKNKNVANIPGSSKCETPLKTSAAKRLLYDIQTHPAKRSRISKEDNDVDDIKQKQGLTRADLDMLKTRIQQKEESVKRLKTTLLYKEKNKAEDLERDIEKWTKGCQSALWDYQKCLQERSGETISIAKILSLFEADPNVVRFSVDEDTFY